MCWLHDPNRSEARRHASQKAGKARWRGDPLGDIQARVDDLYTDVLSGTIPTPVGAVCNQLLQTKLRAIDQQRRSEELEDLRRRLEDLENKGDSSASGASGGWGGPGRHLR